MNDEQRILSGMEQVRRSAEEEFHHCGGDDFFMIYAKEIGERIKKLRTSKNMSQEQLAGLTYAFVNGCERGRYRPDADMLRDLANALECDINDLLKGE